MKKKSLPVFFVGLLMCGCQMKEVINEYNVVPLPVTMSEQQGRFYLNSDVPIVVNASQEVKHIASGLSTTLLDIAGLKLKPTDELHENVPSIVFDSIPGMEKEAYKLSVTPQLIKITASAPNGFYYGLQTLYQLLPVDVYCKERARNAEWSVPCVEIEDAPTFRYRGAMLDVCRHFASIDYIKKFIDVLAAHKMNTFHWHLTEDQGWRMEVPGYPRLATVAARRACDRLGWKDQQPDSTEYGGYYTDDQMRDIVAYAAERCIEIIPEIDIPGHSQAAVAAYPEILACDPENPHEVWRRMGVSDDVINVANPAAVKFAKDVIDHAIDIFPYGYLHLGGDECPTEKWESNPQCTALLDSIGSTNYRDLQLNFYRELQRHIDAKPARDRRRLIFWNEVLHGNTSMLDTSIVIMAWVGADKAAREAAEKGLSTILTPQIPYYINRKQSADPSEPLSQGTGTETLERVYSYVPMADVPDSLAGRYMGVQANFWSEYVSTPEFLEYLMMPRLAAVAEAAWTPQAERDYPSFVTRLRQLLPLYDRMGWNYCRKF